MMFSLLSLLFLFSSLNAHDNSSLEMDGSMNINSGEAVYDGKTIVLFGDVAVQHSLGQISAHRLSLIPGLKKDKKNFSSLEINDSVKVELADGGRLQCQQAKIDYAKMQGIFLGNTEFPEVAYYNIDEGAKVPDSVRAPLEVRSHQMTLELIRETSKAESSSTKTLVKQIEAIQNVRVVYNHDYILSADHALYQRLPTAEHKAQAGILTLSVQNDHSFCQMKNLNGDSFFAKTIQINTIERQMQLVQPEGKLLMSKEKEPLQTLEFKAKEMAWDDQKQTLLLKGDVEILQNGTLQIQTDQEISIVQSNINGKRALRFIQSPENTQISYLDASQKENTHRIHCPGPLTIDHEKFEMVLRGSENSLGQLQDGGQAYIEDVLGDMYADLIRVHYHWKGSRIDPEKIILEGHVRLVNRFDGHLEESGSILHYALADHVEYFPKKQEMALRCLEGSRVLFFDKVNNVQMSAPSLKLRRDAVSKKEILQGEGDVRFTFIEKELAQLKQLFKLSDSSREAAEHAK